MTFQWRDDGVRAVAARPSMLEQMKKDGVPWPRFEGSQMADLIAYLNTKEET